MNLLLLSGFFAGMALREVWLNGDMGSVALTIALGTIVGLCMGLTGGGGSVFAVPLLVYGIGLAAHRAVCTSMAAVAFTAALGAGQKLRRHQIDVPAALTIATGGILGAPVGATIGRLISGRALLVVFGSVVMLAAVYMFMRSRGPNQLKARTAHRERASGIIWLGTAGVFSGVLSGLLGIGGGFVIVPAFMAFRETSIHRAVNTSLLVIALIGIVATTSHMLGGQTVPLHTALLFVLGSIFGFYVGDLLSSSTPPAALQRIRSIVMLIMAAFIIFRNAR